MKSASIARRLVVLAICLALGGSACTTSPDQDATSAASPAAPACDEVALAVQLRVDEARAVLGEETPRIAGELEKTIQLLQRDRRQQANAAYARLKDGIDEVTQSSNQLLDRLSETVTECDRSVTTACWRDVTTAYEASGRTAVAILQGPLRTMLDRIETFFTLGRNVTTKETKSSYMELRAAAQDLRESVEQFADMHNLAAEDFNACISAGEAGGSS